MAFMTAIGLSRLMAC